MPYLMTLLYVFLMLSIVNSCQSDPEILYGDWLEKDRLKHAEYHLRITPDHKVVFEQTIFKSPCIYTFDGHLSNDTIYYTTILSCENLQTKIQEHRWTRLDTFAILESSSTHLKILSLQDNKIKDYVKRSE